MNMITWHFKAQTEHLWNLLSNFRRYEIWWWSTVSMNSKHNPIKVEEDWSLLLNSACEVLMFVHVRRWTSSMQETQASCLPYQLLSSTLHTLQNPYMSSGEAWREIRLWGREVDKEEKEAMIDLSNRHPTLSLQLIRPTSIQQCCRLFLCKHKHKAKSVPALHCLPGSRSALFCLNLK